MSENKSFQKFCEDHALSAKQIEILQELVRNPHRTSNEISQLVDCSASTLNVHIAKIIEKCGVKNRRSLIQKISELAPNVTLSTTGQPLTILLADDDMHFRDRVVAQIRVLLGDMASLWIFENGLELMMHLSRSSHQDPKFPAPDMILLDLIMPTMDGHKTLEKIKTDDRWKNIPVIVFSSSAEKKCVNGSYEKGANSYVVKPSSDKELNKVIRLMLEYWGKVGTFPTQSGQA